MLLLPGRPQDGEGEFKCPVCGVHLRTKVGVERHIRISHKRDIKTHTTFNPLGKYTCTLFYLIPTFLNVVY